MSKLSTSGKKENNRADLGFELGRFFLRDVDRGASGPGSNLDWAPTLLDQLLIPFSCMGYTTTTKITTTILSTYSIDEWFCHLHSSPMTLLLSLLKNNEIIV